jgi:hypothetical protein
LGIRNFRQTQDQTNKGGIKMIRLRSIFVIMLLAAVVAMGVACSGNEAPSQLAGAKSESQPAAMEQKSQPASAAVQQSQPSNEAVQTAQQSASAEIPKSIELTGMVEQSGDGVVIVTDLGKYNVIGQDLSAMVGKTVKVTGAVEESAGQYTIKVLSVQEGE